MSRKRVEEVVRTLQGVERIRGRVYRVVIPASERSWPAVAVRRTGGSTVGNSMRGRADIVTLEILVQGRNVAEVDAAMGDVDDALTDFYYDWPDPPAEAYDDELKAFGQIMTARIKP